MLYEKLPSPSSTRLMSLLPGATDDPLACRLDIVDLDSGDVEYPAISYVWGDPADKKPIHCMNETLMIPTSLFSFLLTVRDEEKEWSGWADAVCINQAEDSEALRERAQQVEMMGAIFSKASMVFVYLGELPEAYDEFLTAAEALDELGPDNVNAQMFDNPDFPDELANLRLDSRIWDTFNDITSRPWYRRVWIVQEFVLAQHIKMCIGDYALDYEVFRSMCVLFEWFYLHLVGRAEPDAPETTPKDADLHKRCRDARLFLHDCRDKYQEAKTISPADFVEAALQLDTTYARDRLYGGYGIIDRAFVRRLPVDFELPVESLSQRLSTQLLQDGHENFLLEHCAGLDKKSPTQDISPSLFTSPTWYVLISSGILSLLFRLPTWCILATWCILYVWYKLPIFYRSPMPSSLPTWCIDLDGKRADSRADSHSTITISRMHGVYTASGTRRLIMRKTTDPRVIVVDGYIIESIKSLTSPYPHIPNAPGAPNTLKWLAVADWIETTLAWLGRVFDISPAGHGGAWEEIPTNPAWGIPLGMLWRTLISDLVHAPSRVDLMDNYVLDEEYRPRPPVRPGPEFAAYFYAWLKIFHLLQQRHRSGRNVDTSSK